MPDLGRFFHWEASTFLYIEKNISDIKHRFFCTESPGFSSIKFSLLFDAHIPVLNND
ncbi:hypothetical protein ED5_0887 [Enterobacter roggenkampii]|nr:hypothetical protein ED5_0887 [Enterobacter roggenkampii]